jgi:hypothetical protein
VDVRGRARERDAATGYKHIDTRRYLHLAADGRAFLYFPDSRYREISPHQAIDLAFHGWNGLYRWRDDDG